MSETYKVRTTIQPDVDLEVGLTEYQTLRALGLIEKASAKADKEVDRVVNSVPFVKE